MRIKKVYAQYFLAPFLPMYVEGVWGTDGSTKEMERLSSASEKAD
jgi:hypothetical protein